MNLFVVALCLIAVAAAAPNNSAQTSARRARPAIQQDAIHDEHGQYAVRYVTAEGTIVSERGRLVPTPDGRDYVLIVEGETSYIGDDGKTYITKYSAGLDGNQVKGTHLPVSVPQPAASQ